jgi:hypothetical protein
VLSVSDKVKLPRRVVDAINYFLHNERLSYSEIVWQSYQVNQTTEHGRYLRDYASDNFVDILQALVNGYEVEETPEDKVRDYIDHLKSTRDRIDLAPERCRSAEYSGRIDSVLQTLSLLNIKIEGVNA